MPSARGSGRVAMAAGGGESTSRGVAGAATTQNTAHSGGGDGVGIVGGEEVSWPWNEMGMDADAAELFSAWALSFVVSIALLLTWRFLIAPEIPGHQTRSQADRVMLANSVVSCYPALTGALRSFSLWLQLTKTEML
eukprot:6211835-Pleurochrysis_carterae.AAC.1